MAYYAGFYFPDGSGAFTLPIIPAALPTPDYLSAYEFQVKQEEIDALGIDWLVTKEKILEILNFVPGPNIDGSFHTSKETGVAIVPYGIDNFNTQYIKDGEFSHQYSPNSGIGDSDEIDGVYQPFQYLVLVNNLNDKRFYPMAASPFSPIDGYIYFSLYTNPSSSWGPVPEFTPDIVNFSFIREPEPDVIVGLKLEPETEYTKVGSQAEFTAKYILRSGEELNVSDEEIEWGAENALNVTNYGDGRFDIDTDFDPNKSPVIVRVVATPTSQSIASTFTAEGRIFVSDSDIDTPISSNQYFPGGISKPSGLPQGLYDNTFGPNTSALIPGLDSTGQSTGEGGAVGNDISLSGMYTKYLTNQSMLNILAQLFWEDNIGIQAAKLLFGNPINSIISLISYPFNLESMVPTVSQNIFLGQYDSRFPGRAISRSSFQIDWGTIPIDFYWGNFLDYAPYTQVQLYLPWGVGFVSIDPNEVMPYSNKPNDFNPVNYNKGSIRVVTNIELDKGSCVHNVIGNRGLVIGSYGGVVGKQIPMTALDNSAKMLALLGAASGIGMAAGNAMAGAATGKYTSVTPKYSTVGYGDNKWVQSLGFAHKFEGGKMLSDMGGSKAMKAGLASAAALASTPPNYPRAGTFSDATNTMCAQVPYIIISRPSQSVPQNYGHYNGYPSNIYYNKLSMVSGYTEISEIHLDNVPGSVEELEELDSMLKGGVLL